MMNAGDAHKKFQVGETSPQWEEAAKTKPKTSTNGGVQTSANSTHGIAGSIFTVLAGASGGVGVNTDGVQKMARLSQTTSNKIDNTTAPKSTPPLNKENVDDLTNLVKQQGIVTNSPKYFVSIRTAWNKRFGESYKLMRDHGNALVSLMAKSSDKRGKLSVKDREEMRDQAVKAREKLQTAMMSEAPAAGSLETSPKFDRMTNIEKIYNSFIDDNENKILEKKSSNTLDKLQMKLRNEGSTKMKSTDFNKPINELRDQLKAAQNKKPIAPVATIKSIETKLHTALKLKAERLIMEKNGQQKNIKETLQQNELHPTKEQKIPLKEDDLKAALQEMDNMLKELEGTGTENNHIKSQLQMKREEFKKLSVLLNSSVQSEFKFSESNVNNPIPNNKDTRIRNGDKITKEMKALDKEISKFIKETQHLQGVLDGNTEANWNTNTTSTQVHLDVSSERLKHLQSIQGRYIELQNKNNNAIYKLELKEMQVSFQKHKGEDLKQVASEYLKLVKMLEDTATMNAFPETKNNIEGQLAIYKTKLGTPSQIEQNALSRSQVKLTSIVARASIANPQIEKKAWYQKDISKGFQNLTGRESKSADVKKLNTSVENKSKLLGEMDVFDQELGAKITELKERKAVLSLSAGTEVELAQIDLQLFEYTTLQSQNKEQMLSTATDTLKTSMQLAAEGYQEDVFVLRDALARANQLLAKYPPPDKTPEGLLAAKTAAFSEIGTLAGSSTPVSFAQQIMLMSWEAGDQMALDKLRGANVDKWVTDLMLNGTDISSTKIKQMSSGLGRSKELQNVVASACMQGEPWALTMLASAMETKATLGKSTEKAWADTTMKEMWKAGATNPSIQTAMAQLCKENQTTANAVHTMLDKSNAKAEVYQVMTKICQGTVSVATLNKDWVEKKLTSDLNSRDSTIKTSAQEVAIEIFKSGGLEFMNLVVNPDKTFIQDPIIQQGIKEIIANDLPKMSGAQLGGMVKPRLEWAFKNMELAGGADVLANAIKTCIETKHEKAEENFTPMFAEKLMNGKIGDTSVKKLLDNESLNAFVETKINEEKRRLSAPVYEEIAALSASTANAISKLMPLLEETTTNGKATYKYGLNKEDVDVFKRIHDFNIKQQKLMGPIEQVAQKKESGEEVTEEELVAASACYKTLVDNERAMQGTYGKYLIIQKTKLERNGAPREVTELSIRPNQHIGKLESLGSAAIANSTNETITRTLESQMEVAKELCLQVNKDLGVVLSKELMVPLIKSGDEGKDAGAKAERNAAINNVFKDDLVRKSAEGFEGAGSIKGFVGTCCSPAKDGTPSLWDQKQSENSNDPYIKVQWYAVALSIPETEIKKTIPTEISRLEGKQSKSADETRELTILKDLLETRQKLKSGEL